MRPSIRSAMIALALAAWLIADCGTAHAGKGGGGGGSRGGRGGGGGRATTGGHARGGKPTTHRVKGDATQSHASGPRGDASAAAGARNSHRSKDIDQHKSPKGADPNASSRPARDENHPWSMQRANEERKLNHRLGVADRLERKADANGNEHLRSTAERMRQKAHEHYAKRLEKIDSKLPTSGDGDALPEELPDDLSNGLPDGRQPAPEGVDSSPAAPLVGQKLTGRQNALSRQLLNEERKLAHQTDLAERLRAIAEQQGDSALLKTADRLEQQALDRFENRMEAIRSFEERHGLAVGDSH